MVVILLLNRCILWRPEKMFTFKIRKTGTTYWFEYAGVIIKKEFNTKEEAYQWLKAKAIEENLEELQFLKRLLMEEEI